MHLFKVLTSYWFDKFSVNIKEFGFSVTNRGLQDEVTEKKRLDFEEASEGSSKPSSVVEVVVIERKRHGIYQEILQSYDELKIDRKNLKEGKEKNSRRSHLFLSSYYPHVLILNLF